MAASHNHSVGEGERRVDAIESMGLSQLSPLLTLFDAFLGHRSPLLSPASADNADPVLSLDLAKQSALFGRFMNSARAALVSALGRLELRMTASQGSLATIVLIDQSNGRELTRQGALECVRLVEGRLGQPALVRDMLQPITEKVMEACTQFIGSRCGKYLDIDKVRRCVVQPAVFFGEEWSVGLETAWQASGAEGILTMPNYAQWTDAHKQHRARSWRGAEERVCDGRLWRFEAWECLRTPCHEVIHLVQHIAGQRMSIQVAEHDGAFSTYLLMLAVSVTVKQAAKEGAADGGAGSFYYPGAVEEALLESVEYIARVMNGHNYIGHNYIGHNCVGHNCVGHNCVGHNYAGHDCVGHNCIWQTKVNEEDVTFLREMSVFKHCPPDASADISFFCSIFFRKGLHARGRRCPTDACPAR